MPKIKTLKPAASLLLVGIWLALLFAESSQPPAQFISALPGLDKLAHFCAFGLLALQLSLVSFWLNGNSTARLLYLPFAIAALIGGLEELYQTGVPDRQASVYDLAADIAGAATALILLSASGGFNFLKRWR